MLSVIDYIHCYACSYWMLHSALLRSGIRNRLFACILVIHRNLHAAKQSLSVPTAKVLSYGRVEE
jgi:hypothetical protein